MDSVAFNYMNKIVAKKMKAAHEAFGTQKKDGDKMELELGNLNFVELKELASEVEREIKSREKTRIKEAKTALAEVAKQYGLSIEEIVASDVKRVYNTAPKKYRNPNNHSEVWTGRGKKPNWVVDLIHVYGMSLEQLLIENQEANAEPSSPAQFNVQPQQTEFYQAGA